MKNPNISKILKTYRKLNHYTVNDVVLRLEENRIPVAAKTVYGWESGQTQPDADTLLVLCKIYRIDNILETFGYEDAEEDFCLSAEEKVLVKKYRENTSMQPAVRKLLGME